MAVTRGDDGDRPSASRVSVAAGSQGTLFDDSEVPGLPGEPSVSGQPGAAGPSGSSAEPGADSSELGYRGPTACAAAGITYRQLDYWARTALVEPSVRAAHGSGSQRL